MKSIITLALLFTLSFFFHSIGYAADFVEFKKIARETIKQAKSGHIDNIDQLIKMQTQLINIGKKATRNYGATNPKAAKMMRFVVAEVDHMKAMSLMQIEIQWHGKAFLKAKGIPDSLLFEQSKTGNIIDTVIHPATTYILLSEYKTSKDEKLLQQVVGELEEVLHHIDLI
ncbi:MAG: hypothetical protein ACC653_12995 [Gammaproteobacteria bacterium]